MRGRGVERENKEGQAEMRECMTKRGPAETELPLAIPLADIGTRS
jgi:hypothetical protein